MAAEVVFKTVVTAVIECDATVEVTAAIITTLLVMSDAGTAAAQVAVAPNLRAIVPICSIIVIAIAGISRGVRTLIVGEIVIILTDVSWNTAHIHLPLVEVGKKHLLLQIVVVRMTWGEIVQLGLGQSSQCVQAGLGTVTRIQRLTSERMNLQGGSTVLLMLIIRVSFLLNLH